MAHLKVLSGKMACTRTFYNNASCIACLNRATKRTCRHLVSLFYGNLCILNENAQEYLAIHSTFSQAVSCNLLSGLLRMLTIQLDLITDKGYLERSIKYAIDCGVIDQWMLGRVRGFPPKEDMEVEEEEEFADPNGIRSITEEEYRTLVPVS